MKLILSPQRIDDDVTYIVSGDTFLINGQPIDLSGDWAALESDTEGEPLEPSGRLIAGERDPGTGEITLTVRAPNSANAPESDRFPDPVDVLDGESVVFPMGVA